MSIIRNDPFFADFDRFFTPIFRRSSDKAECSNALRASSSFRRSIDVKETDYGYLAQLSLPGVKKEDVDISLDKGVISVKATHKQGSAQEERTWHNRESHFGVFSRSWHVPPALTHNDIEASLNGVLSLNYPKEAEGAKKVTIS